MKSNYKSIIIMMFKILYLIFFSIIGLYSIHFGTSNLSIPYHIIMIISLIPLTLLKIKEKNWFLIILFGEGILFIGINLIRLIKG